jgi:hypothetical protein
MDLRIDTLFSQELEMPHDERHDLEAALLALGANDAPHVEDAFLADFARWLRARRRSSAQRRSAIEFAREALEHVGEPDGAWQGLPVERLLCDGEPSAATARAVHARDLVIWLGERGSLGLHGQRVLARRLAAVRIAAAGLRHAVGDQPPLAA